jgi:hypothetical protein
MERERDHTPIDKSDSPKRHLRNHDGKKHFALPKADPE